MSKSSNKAPRIITAVLALANIFFVPVFHVWGGLFPSEPNISFLDVVEAIFEEKDAFHFWPVIITVVIFVPSLLMLLTSFADSHIPYEIVSFLGLAGVALNVLSYIDQCGTDAAFDFKYSSISIGTWTALFLFGVAFVVSLNSKKSISVNRYPIPSAVHTYSRSEDNSAYTLQTQTGMFCPQCGTVRKESDKFCSKCGIRFL